MSKSAFGNSAAYSIICEFLSNSYLKGALCVICIEVKIGKKGIWISFHWMSVLQKVENHLRVL